jgi:predicted DNA-binding transcriptional regulator AlpA
VELSLIQTAAARLSSSPRIPIGAQLLTLFVGSRSAGFNGVHKPRGCRARRSIRFEVGLPEVCAATGFGRSFIYQLQVVGGFPQRVKLGVRAVGWCIDVLRPRRISGRKTLKCRIAFIVSSDEDDCIELRESMISFPEYPSNLHGSQIGTKIVT